MATEISTWEELIDTTRDASAAYEWTGGDLDFNDIQPEGFSSGVTIKGIIDFKGATFKNFVYRGTAGAAITFNKTGTVIDSAVKNLKIHDMIIQPDTIANITAVSCSDTGNNKHHLDNCELSVTFNNSPASNTVAGTALGGYAAHTCCSIKVISTILNGYLVIANNSYGFRDCLVDLDVTQNSTTANTPCFGVTLNNCLVRGKIVNNNANTPSVLIGNGSSKCNQFMLEGNYKILSTGGKSIYDSTKMTLTNDSTGMIAFDPTDPDMSALRSAGFPCAVS